jgi:quercetin dioxygenase-like cupin family protein
MNRVSQSSMAGVVPPEGGRGIHGFGDMVAKVPTEAFDRRLFVLQASLPSGAFIPPHTHSREDEVAFILSGELTFDVGGTVSIARAGAFALKPRGVYHAFWNHTHTPTQVLEFHTPALMEPYYEELGRLFTANDLTQPERQTAISALHLAYGIVYHPDLAEHLVAAHGLQPQPPNAEVL